MKSIEEMSDTQKEIVRRLDMNCLGAGLPSYSELFEAASLAGQFFRIPVEDLDKRMAMYVRFRQLIPCEDRAV